MTLDQAKNQVAKNHDYPNWTNLLHDFYDGNSPAQFIEECEDEAAELYARSKWDEGFDTSIKKFEQAKTYAKTLVEAIQLAAVLAILDVTKKEFKP